MATIQRCLSTRAHGGKSIFRQKRESPRVRPFDSHLDVAAARQREATKEISRRLSPSLVAAKGKRRNTVESTVRKVRESRKVDSFESNSLQMFGGRINRKIVKKEKIGGSVAVTMSATARHRKAKASARDTISQDGSSKIVNETNVPLKEELMKETLKPTNSDSSTIVPMAGALLSALGIVGYFSLQNVESNVTDDKLVSTKA